MPLSHCVPTVGYGGLGGPIVAEPTYGMGYIRQPYSSGTVPGYPNVLVPQVVSTAVPPGTMYSQQVPVRGGTTTQSGLGGRNQQVPGPAGGTGQGRT